MAPATKTSKILAKDIRTFFGGSSASSSQKSHVASPSKLIEAQHGRNKEAISDDDRPLKQKKPSFSQSPRAKALSARQEEPNVNGSRNRASESNPAPSTSKVVDVLETDDDDDDQPPRQAARKRKKPPTFTSDDDFEPAASAPPKKKPALVTSSSSKSKSKPRASTARTNSKVKGRDGDYVMSSSDDIEEVDAEDEDEIVLQPKKSTSASKTKSPVKKPLGSPKKKKDSESAAVKEDVPKKPNWAAIKAAKMAGPIAPGSKQVPVPASPDCLAGLSFVFTGELSGFSRDEAADIAKRFGGRVVGQPSTRTNYVVLGEHAGPSKLAAIKKHGLTTLSEDEFLNLIATRKGPGDGKGYDEKTRKKMEKEQNAIRQAAKELEKREKAAKQYDKDHPSHKIINASAQLWTTRYAPQTLKEICGNKGQVEKLQQWLNDWPNNLKSGFKKPGKNGMNIFRALLITGPPGIGKTTSAHLCAKLAGFIPIELNASDTRSKKLVENGMNINNKSLDGFIAGNHAKNEHGITITDRTCLIMDEVDGMSAGDRGGVGALNALIRKTKVPIICIANDRGAQKLKPLMSTTFSLPFRKPDVAAVRSRILTIAFKEKMDVPANVIDQLIAGAQSDIRQVLNMLSTWKLSSDSMTFDESKSLAKMNEKYALMTPFDVTAKMLGPYLFSATARETLGDKIELYFHDHAFVPLFIQENYMKTQPARLRNLDGPDKILKQLELMDKAASSISDGDLVDSLIHGPEQHWSLMPLHAVCSSVRPASFLYGQGAGYGGPNAMSFPQWLGQNSKQNKLSRQLADVQIRMRLKVSGDKPEIRQSYLPALFPHLVKPLMDQGASAIEEVIERMDNYYLSREDWDTIVELGVDQNKDDLVLKKISASTKSSLTRKYNGMDHPIPFHKAQDLGRAPKKIASEPVPDIEDAFDLDEIADEASEDEKSKASDDISGDKLIQVPKKKGKTAKGKVKNSST